MLARLRRERHSPRPTERLRQPSEHCQVGVECDPLKTADAKRRKPVLILEPAELPLDGCAATVEAAPPLRLTRDQRVEAARLDPPARGLALAARARSPPPSEDKS